MSDQAELLIAIPMVAQDLIVKHGLQGWKFAWTNHLTIKGQCSHHEREIRYSRNFLESSPASIVDTLLHEVAHAIAGPGHGHDEYWRKIAISLGCNGERCHSEEGSKPYAHSLTCTACEHEYRYHRLPKRYWKLRCRCGGTLSLTNH